MRGNFLTFLTDGVIDNPVFTKKIGQGNFSHINSPLKANMNKARLACCSLASLE